MHRYVNPKSLLRVHDYMLDRRDSHHVHQNVTRCPETSSPNRRIPRKGRSTGATEPFASYHELGGGYEDAFSYPPSLPLPQRKLAQTQRPSRLLPLRVILAPITPRATATIIIIIPLVIIISPQFLAKRAPRHTRCLDLPRRLEIIFRNLPFFDDQVRSDLRRC